MPSYGGEVYNSVWGQGSVVGWWGRCVGGLGVKLLVLSARDVGIGYIQQSGLFSTLSPLVLLL